VLGGKHLPELLGLLGVEAGALEHFGCKAAQSLDAMRPDAARDLRAAFCAIWA
jgi:hypothetical protein